MREKGPMKTVKENHEFQRAYHKGKAFVAKEVVVYVFRNRRCKTISRYGITAGKKIGNAVTRNRARRVIRAAYRAIAPELRPGYDFIFVARGRTPNCKSTRLYACLKSLLSAYMK